MGMGKNFMKEGMGMNVMMEGRGAMRRGVFGSMSLVAKEEFEVGFGSGMRIASKWQFGVLGECMSLRRG